MQEIKPEYSIIVLGHAGLQSDLREKSEIDKILELHPDATQIFGLDLGYTGHCDPRVIEIRGDWLESLRKMNQESIFADRVYSVAAFGYHANPNQRASHIKNSIDQVINILKPEGEFHWSMGREESFDFMIKLLECLGIAYELKDGTPYSTYWSDKTKVDTTFVVNGNQPNYNPNEQHNLPAHPFDDFEFLN